MVAAVSAGHVLLLILLLSYEVVRSPRPRPEPTVVTLVELPVEPSPQAPPPDQADPAPGAVRQPPIVAPSPEVRTATPAPPAVQTAPQPQPQRAVVVVPPQAQPGPPGPVSTADLASTMISAKPPKYPIESRRRHEEGTVVLAVLVGTSGGVVEVSVAKSSGFDRLDKAALAAVRGWRWSPTLRDGQPVMVKGFVDIPFMLTG